MSTMSSPARLQGGEEPGRRNGNVSSAGGYKAPSVHSSRDSTSSLGQSYSYTSYRDSSPLRKKKMTNTVRASNKAAILAVGEELRLLLHEENPPLLKDRRYHLKVYEKCFVGYEMVDWLLKKGEVESRMEAVAMMQKLLDHGVVHHGKLADLHSYIAVAS